MQVELAPTTDIFESEGVHFTSFAMMDGKLVGVTADSRVLDVEMIHRKGSVTEITYYEEGEARIAKRHSGRYATRTRTY